MARRLHRVEGSVVTLRNRRKVAGHAPQRLCRVTLAFVCDYCGREFLASVVALFDPHRYRSTHGVGERLTPDHQLPRWCPPPRDCKNAARRKPKATCTCALDGCDRTFKVAGKSNKRYCCSAHQVEAASWRKAAKRQPFEPSIEFALAGEIVEHVADILGLNLDRRVRLEAAYAATAARQTAEEALQEAQALVAAAQAKVTALDAESPTVSTAGKRLAALDAELEASADEREHLNERLRIIKGPFGHNVRDAEQVRARLDQLDALALDRQQVAQEAVAAPAWEAAQARALEERRVAARRELQVGRNQVVTAQAHAQRALEEEGARFAEVADTVPLLDESVPTSAKQTCRN